MCQGNHISYPYDASSSRTCYGRDPLQHKRYAVQIPLVSFHVTLAGPRPSLLLNGSTTALTDGNGLPSPMLDIQVYICGRGTPPRPHKTRPSETGPPRCQLAREWDRKPTPHETCDRHQRTGASSCQVGSTGLPQHRFGQMNAQMFETEP